MRTRLGKVILVAAAVIPTGVVVAAGPAGAKTKAPPPSIACKVTGSATISPGVSETPAKQTLTVTLSLSSCTGSSVAGITGTSQSGSTTEKGKTPETCASLLEPGTPTKSKGTINWNNGTTSMESVTSTLGDPGPGESTVTGKISKGTFKKGKVAAALTDTLGAGQNCTSVPVTSATITGTYTIS
ncbi:MAG: hypothetical protein ACRDY1_03830 [Acidimicrobiales bacterium]